MLGDSGKRVAVKLTDKQYIFLVFALWAIWAAVVIGGYALFFPR